MNVRNNYDGKEPGDKVTRKRRVEEVENAGMFSMLDDKAKGWALSWQMTTDSETMEQYLTFLRSRFLISVLVFVSRDYELGRVSDFGGVDRQSRTG